MNRWTLLAAACLLATSEAQAATIKVTNTLTSGAGSLAKAITDANATVAPDTIEFAITTLGIKVIPGPFPPITHPLTIDGYTDKDSHENTATDNSTNAAVSIRLDGSPLASGASILQIDSEDVLIRGLAIDGIPLKGTGIKVSAGVNDVVIVGCFIGVDPNGTTDASMGAGLILDGTAVVGTPDPADRNLISANNNLGILVRSFSSIIQNNLIGTNAAGLATLGNGIGIQVSTADAHDEQIGGLEATAGNVIAGNVKQGILIASNAGSGISIEGNRIFANGELGIDIGGTGTTFNDEFDSDEGPNHLQNYPEIAFARRNGTKLRIEGTLPSAPGTYRIEFFSSSDPDPSGFGEGQTLLGSLTTQIPGNKRFAPFRVTFTVPVFFPSPAFVTATAERQTDHSTGEFSRAVPVVDGGTEITVVNTSDTGIGSLRDALDKANTMAGANTIVFAIPGAGAHVILAKSELVIGSTVVIDGYSQTGAAPSNLYRGSDATLRIEVDGSQIVSGPAIFDIANDGIVIRGLAIHSSPNAGIRLSGAAEDAIIEGNFIGTDVTGAIDFGNAGPGIHTGDGIDTRIGGLAVGNRNLISGNDREGIVERGVRTTIVGNLVGADSLGTPALGNDETGVRLLGKQTLVGSDEPLRFNQIVGNIGPGISVADETNGLQILGNDIDGNGGLGIDLLEAGNAFGLTLNDNNDPDPGANRLQNFPVLTSVGLAPGVLSVQGSLDVPVARVGTTYRLRVFASDTCDPSDHGEGQHFVGAVNVAIPANEKFTFPIGADVAEGSQITMTATDPQTGDTSEFSECLQAGEAAITCGDASGDEKLSAGDALLVLKAAVGSAECELCFCDVNDSTTINATDALLTLKAAVGQDIELDCPICTF